MHFSTYEKLRAVVIDRVKRSAGKLNVNVLTKAGEQPCFQCGKEKCGATHYHTCTQLCKRCKTWGCSGAVSRPGSQPMEYRWA